jgi:hypothetical protein
MRLFHNCLHGQAAAQRREKIFASVLLPGTVLDERSWRSRARRCARRSSC